MMAFCADNSAALAYPESDLTFDRRSVTFCDRSLEEDSEPFVIPQPYANALNCSITVREKRGTELRRERGEGACLLIGAFCCLMHAHMFMC